MNAAEVPSDLVEAAKPALVDLLATEGVFAPADHPRFDHVARRILAAVLPLAQAEAWEEGYGSAHETLGIEFSDNPYRAARLRAAETERTS